MATCEISAPRLVGVSTCVPRDSFDNEKQTTTFPPEEVRKIVGVAGVAERRVADERTCSTDLCASAAKRLLEQIGWGPDDVDGLIMVTQTPDYFLPSSACLVHQRLGLPTSCAAFDVGLGCSGYTYGLWLASSLLQAGGLRRVLLLHGETPSRFTSPDDRAVFLLFGDAGSATALERRADDAPLSSWYFSLHTDGAGHRALIIDGGGFRERFPEDQRRHCLSMDGAGIFQFTIKRVPSLIRDTLELAGIGVDDPDYYVFHQSNQFIMRHLMQKCRLPKDRVPIILKRFGNTGGPSVPLTMTQAVPWETAAGPVRLMLLGYGVGLSWSSALIDVDPTAVRCHGEWNPEKPDI
jgi:3-oxoacyl-[acyl-carrier-protein] synthase-3